jgi:alanine racemase
MPRHSSRIEISRSALKQNLEFLRSRIGESALLSMVVKANAYGHGVEHVVPMAENLGVKHFSVASSQEAESVLEVQGPDARVMIMGILYDEDLPWAIEREVEFFVFDLPRLREAARVAQELGVPARIHLEVETGANRTGLPESDLDEAVRILRKSKARLVLAGICSHFGGIETLANQFRIQAQIRRFASIRSRLAKKNIRPERYHLACSAAALAFPDTVLDQVRVGSAAYGVWPSPDIQNLVMMQDANGRKSRLRRLLSWKTNVMALKDVARSDFVGYGTSFQAPRDMRVAVLPVGYGNGYPRSQSNRGNVLVRGHLSPVVGAVNMNMVIIDVTHVPNVAIGDEVVLVGRQKGNTIALRSFSEFTHHLNTEFLSRLPASIPRVAVR